MKRSFKLAFEFVFRGKVVSKIIFTMLSAFSFALFALASTAYTYREEDFVIRNFQGCLKERGCLVFYDNEEVDKNRIPETDLQIIRENFPYEYIYTLKSTLNPSGYAANYREYEKKLMTQEWFEKMLSVLGELNYGLETCAIEELFPAAGCTLLEGKFPSNADEIAVHKKVFDFLCWSGFQEGEKIFSLQSYSDLLGRKMQDGDGKWVTIVGIFDREPPAPKDFSSYAKILSAPCYLRADAWREEAEGNIFGMYVPLEKDEITYSLCQKCKDVTEKLQENFKTRCALKGMEAPEKQFMRVGAESLAGNFHIVEDTNIWLLALIFAGAGGVFLVFSVILSVRMIGDIMEKKRNEIGILISLGASKSKLYLYFALGFSLLALSIFVLALGTSCTVYFAFLKPWIIEGFYVCCMQFNLWTVLILFSVTFLCTLSPVLMSLKKYFKRSAMENLKTI